MIGARAALRSLRNSLVDRSRSLKTFADTHPVVTNALVYGGLYTLAEVSQQNIRNRTNFGAMERRDLSASKGGGAHLDMSSVKRYAIMGTVVFPPILTKWYHWLDSRFPCTSKPVVMKKLFLDQFLLTPWLVAIFFIGMSYMEGLRGDAVLDECKVKFLKTFVLDCCYWLPVQALNFLFIPPMLRVVYIGVTTFVWLNVLCYIKSLPH